MSFNPKDYPVNWQVIRARILARSDGRCECLGHCSINHLEQINRHYEWTEYENRLDSMSIKDKKRCYEKNGERALFARGRIVLTVAHICHHSDCDKMEHLLHLCNGCHLRFDKFMHAKHAAQTRLGKQMEFE